MFAHACGRIAQQLANEIHAIGAACQGQFRLCPVFGRQVRHALRVDVGRVAQNQVPRAGQRLHAIRDLQLHALRQAVLVHVDACNGERIGRNVCARDFHFRVRHGGQDGQAAIAGAQIEHTAGVFPQKVVNAAVGQQFSDEAAGHDGALVHVKRHALQPGLMRKVGRRFARLDALVDQRIDRSRFFGSHGAVGGGIWRVRQVAVQGQAQAPQYQPGSFVFGVGRAVAKSQSGRRQPLSSLCDGGSDGQGLGGCVAHAATAMRCSAC